MYFFIEYQYFIALIDFNNHKLVVFINIISSLCFLVVSSGAGVFFIPYFVFLFFCGIPLFFLETAMGQYTSEGGVTAWRKMCPMFQGKTSTQTGHGQQQQATINSLASIDDK